LKSGCAHGLLDQREDSLKLLRKVRDAGACILVVDSTTETIFEDSTSHTTRVKFDWLQLEATQNHASTTLRNLNHSTRREPAIITFPPSASLTSELTANVLDHRSVCSWYETNPDKLQFSTLTRTLHTTSYVSDVANLELLATLMAGGCVCVVPDTDYATRADVLQDTIRRLKVSHLFITPTILRSFRPATISSLKHLVLHSEPFDDEIICRLTGTVQTSAVHTSAACVFATFCMRITSDSVLNNFRSTPSRSLWIVKPESEEKLTPIGAVGELWMDEHLVSSSYIGICKATSVPQFYDRNSVSRGHGGRLCKTYKTGELAKYEDDGSVTIITQQKLSSVQGHSANIDTMRLEQHIRRALAGTENLHLLVDIVKFSDSVGQTVVGFLSLRSLPSDSLQCLEQKENESSAAVWFQEMSSKVQQQLSLNFPPFMLPTHYVLLNFMPITLSDTIDREKVRSFACTIESTAVRFDAKFEAAGKIPTSIMEILMQEMWAKVLRTQSSSVASDDTFIPVCFKSCFPIPCIWKFVPGYVSWNEYLKPHSLVPNKYTKFDC
jgi:acyl-CoA synthetase (AMP-forming)/AMP-acid ligase II